MTITGSGMGFQFNTVDQLFVALVFGGLQSRGHHNPFSRFTIYIIPIHESAGSKNILHLPCIILHIWTPIFGNM